jgi:hypothetical protein
LCLVLLSLLFVLLLLLLLLLLLCNWRDKYEYNRWHISLQFRILQIQCSTLQYNNQCMICDGAEWCAGRYITIPTFIHN